MKDRSGEFIAHTNWRVNASTSFPYRFFYIVGRDPLDPSYKYLFFKNLDSKVKGNVQSSNMVYLFKDSEPFEGDLDYAKQKVIKDILR